MYLQIFPGPLYITSAIITFNSVFFVSHKCRASVILSIYIHSLFLGPAVYRSLRNRRTHAHTHIYTTRASSMRIYSPVIETFSLKFAYRKLHPARAPRPRCLYYIILRLFVALLLYLHISGRRGS